MESETEEIEDTITFSNFRIIKNVLVLSSAFLLICTSVDGLQMLQSTLNRDEGIGVVSIAIQFALGCFIALFFMKYAILKLGTKKVLTICLVAHMPCTVANFYPHWYTMVPAYAILGIACTLFWGSNSTYLTDISNKYANNFIVSNQSIDAFTIEQTNASNNGHFKNCTDVFEKDDQIYPTSFKSQIQPGTNINCCDIQTISKTVTDHKNAEALKTKNNMPSVFELANATIQTIACIDKPGSGKAAYKFDSASVKIGNNITTVNPLDRLDRINNASSTSNLTETLTKDFSTTNPLSKSIAFQENNINTTLPKTELNSATAKNSIDKLETAIFSENCNDKFNRTFPTIPKPIISASSITKKHQNQNNMVSLLVESTTARFFGIHSMFYQSGHIWSNIVSFYVLQRGVVNDTYIHDSSCMCGADFCNIESECFESNLKEPSKEVKYILISIFLALNILAVLLIAIFLDPLKNRNNVHYSMDFALATFNQLKRPLQLLIVPLSIYMGMTQGFFYADYPKAFVGCAWGMHHVGLVTITFGVTCSAASTLSGWLVKHIGRRIIFLMAGAINVAVNIIMLLWTPDSNQPIMFFVVAGLWGIVMASLWSQLKAFHGVLFKTNEEAAFGCYELCHSIGACVTFACSNYICLYVKIYMLLFVSSIGMIGYLVAEKIRPQNK